MGMYDAMMKRVHDKAKSVDGAEDEECPMCGYYCLGKGGIGCIDKPGLVRCYAQQVTKTKRRVGWFHWSVLFAGIVLIVYSQSHDTVAVEVPVHDGQLIQEYKIKLEAANKTIADYKKQAEVVKGLLKVSLANEAKLTDQLKALSASVPSQPVILEAIQKEAVTEKGLRQVVARNFGKDIAAHIQIIKE